MSWLKDVVTPKIKAFMGGRDSPIRDTLWTKCPACEKMLYTTDLKGNLMVCEYCEYHFRLSPKERLESIFDEKVYESISLVEVNDDPLKFKDIKKYSDRLREAREKTGLYDSAIIGCGLISNIPAIVFVMDFAFMGGSMGRCVGQSFIKAVNKAIESKAVFISVSASGGARMQEGMLSLMQMAGTVSSVCRLKENKLPYINIFTHPTTGGVLASFATIGDIHIAEPGALIGFAGARVIEKTIKRTLPEGFQKSAFLKEHGLIDIIVSRLQLRARLCTILPYITKP